MVSNVFKILSKLFINFRHFITGALLSTSSINASNNCENTVEYVTCFFSER